MYNKLKIKRDGGHYKAACLSTADVPSLLRTGAPDRMTREERRCPLDAVRGGVASIFTAA